MQACCCRQTILTSAWELEYSSFLLLTFPTWRSADQEVASSSSKWFNYPHLRALPGPRVVPGPTQPYSFKMFKPLFIKFAPVVLMLLLTLAVKCYSRILNWHPLLHVKKTAMKPESLADTLSAASQGGHPLNTRPLLLAQDKVGCSGQPLQPQSHCLPTGCWVCLCLWDEWQLYLWATILVRAVGTTGYPSALGCLCWGLGAGLAHRGLFVSASFVCK